MTLGSEQTVDEQKSPRYKITGEKETRDEEHGTEVRQITLLEKEDLITCKFYDYNCSVWCHGLQHQRLSDMEPTSSLSSPNFNNTKKYKIAAGKVIMGSHTLETSKPIEFYSFSNDERIIVTCGGGRVCKWEIAHGICKIYISKDVFDLIDQFRSDGGYCEEVGHIEEKEKFKTMVNVLLHEDQIVVRYCHSPTKCMDTEDILSLKDMQKIKGALNPMNVENYEYETTEGGQLESSKSDEGDNLKIENKKACLFLNTGHKCNLETPECIGATAISKNGK